MVLLTTIKTLKYLDRYGGANLQSGSDQTEHSNQGLYCMFPIWIFWMHYCIENQTVLSSIMAIRFGLPNFLIFGGKVYDTTD